MIIPLIVSKVLEIIKDRYSVRDYDAKPIEEEKLQLILEAARLAPSASNSQPWHFYVVKDKSKIAALAEKMPLGTRVIGNSFIAEAPVVIVATAGPIDLIHQVAAFIVNRKWYYIDIGIALEHMALTAWDLGIGSCWVGWFDEKKIKSLLSIPKGEEVVAMLTLGYPREPGDATKHRKALSEIVKVIS
jgi:nitroreductase